MTTTERPFFQSRRRAAAGLACLATGFLSALGAMALPAAADGPAYFANPGYDTYLKAAHRGVAAESLANGTCPDVPGAGETAWHFVLDDSDHDFATFDAAFTIGDSTVVLSGLTPKAASDPTFDPALNFAPEPTGKHAYVFTANTGTVLDAAAHVTPDALLDDFQLSHTCVGEGTTTTTTVATTPTTTVTTVSVLDTVVTRPSVTVQGVQVVRELPRTGAGSTLPLGQVAIALIGLGLALLGAARVDVRGA